ncbi:hypothetical protein Tco_1194338 [Tanacetum coccineum]
MVSVPIHQDTSSVPPMTTPVIDLTKPQSDSPFPTSTAITLIITTTTSLQPTPPPQSQQSTADPILLKRIGELEQHMVDLVQNNLALEESLHKHGSWMYKLENLNIPHQVSKVVNEIVTDAVDWAISYWSMITQTNSYQIWMKLARREKRRDIPRTPSRSPPSPPPPLPPPAGTSNLGGSRSSQMPLPPPPPSSTGTFGSAQPQSSKALSSSKTVATIPQSMAWTTSDTRYESPGVAAGQESFPTYSVMNDDSILNEQVQLFDDEDTGNDHLPKADMRKDWWKPLPEEERPATPEPAWTIPSSNVSDVENNWASVLASTYETPAEN